jgi:catalase
MLADSLKAVEGQISQEFVAAMGQHRHWDRANLDAVPA